MPKVTENLGDLLVHRGVVDPAEISAALAEQSQTHERLGEILIRRGLLTEELLLDALAGQLGLRRFDPARDAVEQLALELVPLDYARRHGLLPVRLEEKVLVVATCDPLDMEALDPLSRAAARKGRKIELLLAPRVVIDAEREVAYARAAGTRDVRALIDRVVDEVDGDPVSEEAAETEAQRRAQEAGIVRLVDQIIYQAAQSRATDIHIEPQETGLVIRYRVDGLLHEALRPPRAVLMGAISRVKILAQMDIAERRAPQDGRFTYRRDGVHLDIRVSAIPTIHGEKLVLRLLDKTGFNFSLRDLGFSAEDYRIFLNSIRQPYGMVLLSGPTGSGKTTTLYASLLEVRDATRNITTIEDPVEYQVAGINQVQVSDRKGVTFANALRSFLRQDPDIIMVGEIRDQDTADIAVRAALTGHLVFSTIHANDAPTTATRLVSMGAEPFMTASSLMLVAAQRLVRRNCRHCLADYEPDKDALRSLGWHAPANAEAPRFQRGTGCAACEGRGFRGRVAIVERMPLTSGIRDLVAANRPAGEIRQLALEEGMVPLRQSGLAKALDGTTTVEEVLRVCLTEE